MSELDDLLAATVQKSCECCQGHSMPGRKQGEPGYCPSCGGTLYVQISRYASLTDAQRVGVLEREVLRLRPDLAAKYGKRE